MTQIGFHASVEVIFNIYGSDLVALALKPVMAVSVIRDVSHQSLCIPLIVNVYFSVALEPGLFVVRNGPFHPITLYAIT